MSEKPAEKPDEISLEEKIKIIVRQTNYTEDEAKLKIQESDYLSVIKEYMGSKPIEKKQINNSSLNQEIYRQIRFSLHNQNEKI